MLTIYAADGTQNGDMTQPSVWPALSPLLVLNNLMCFDQLQGAAPNDTTGGPHAFRRQCACGGTDVLRWTGRVTGWGTLSFKGVVQFTPTGEGAGEFYGACPLHQNRH